MRTRHMTGQTFSVLIADDSEADRFFIKRAISQGAPRLRVVGVVRDGEEAVAYLAGQGRYADRAQHPLPELLLLDVRMPKRDGLGVLEWLQANPLSGLKVAMMADSSGTDLSSRALQLGAFRFFSKIVHGDDLVRLVQELQTALEGEQAAGAE
jgi:CheY-like chemotaxis protein